MDVTCRKMSKEDFPEAVAIAQESINNVDPAFYDYVKEMTDSLGVETEGAVAEADGKIIGIMYFIRGMHLTGGRTDFFAEIKEQIGSDSIWTGAIAAVAPQYRRLNVAKKLLEYSFQLLRKLNIRHILVEIWIRPDGYMPVYNSLYYAPSFTDYGNIAEYYAKAPGAESRACSVCGEHCHCSAKIAVMHL